MKINNIKDSIQMVFSFLKRYKYTIAVFIYFQLIVYFQIRTALERGHYLYYIINASSLLFILHLISKSKLILRIILSVVFSILVAFEAYYGFFFRCTISLGIISSIMVTNFAEASDVMSSRMVSSLIIVCLTFWGLFKSGNELKRMKVSAKWSMVLLSFYMFCFYPLYVFRKIKSDNDFADYFKDHQILSHQMMITDRFPLLYGQMISVAAFFDEKKKEKEYLSLDRTLPEGVFWEDTDGLPEKIFFVLGESQYRKHLSLYGYEVKTTPFLDSLFQTSSNMKVYDAVSSGCTTMDAARHLFTFATPNNNLNPFFENKNLIELANDAGYQTIWLSNQTTFETWGTITTHFSSLAHDVYFTGYEETAKRISDLKLIPKLREKYNKNTKQFFVINLQGSHGGYSNKSDEIDAAVIKGNSIFNQYDRSIHHTDRVLREIYNVVKADTSSVLFYISDHGQSIDMGGHGMINGGFRQFDVPMFVINQSQINVDAIIDQYFLHDKNRINTVSTINILAELMGYSFSDEMISELREESNYIFHVNWQVYKWDELE